uniref:Uncharacterized protein n=1 Tax=Glossina austeni TaxID=7395 RepID=A0A1A9UZK9_GLOAU
MLTLLSTFLWVDASTSTKRHVVVAVFVAADAVSAADQIPDDGDDGMPNRDQKVFEFAHEDNQRVLQKPDDPLDNPRQRGQTFRKIAAGEIGKRAEEPRRLFKAPVWLCQTRIKY